MKWWGYLSIVLAMLLVSYIFTYFQKIKGIFGEIMTYFAVRSQKYRIKNFAFKARGETIFFDYLVINSSGVFAITLHNLKGDLRLRKGRILLQGRVKMISYMYFNPVPHDVRKVILLNGFVPEETDVIPVIIFPRGNDKNIRAMWLTPVKELKKVFNESSENPLPEEQVISIYNKLKSINVKSSAAKKKDRGFIKRRCPDCGAYLYERQAEDVFYIQCSKCSFRRDLTSSTIPEE